VGVDCALDVVEDVKQFGLPQSPADLSRHDCPVFSDAPGNGRMALQAERENGMQNPSIRSALGE
jgi:hypothetical protein